jgi:outer membrane cobalamin receptor
MKRILLSCFISAIILLQPSLLKAQTILGKIIDAVSHQPLEAALIKLPNNSNILSDNFGNFSLQFTNTSYPISISCIGYKPLIINIANEKTLNIAMQPDAIKLQDVIVLEATTKTKFSSLAKIDLDLKPVSNTQELLRTVPGLFIAQHAGGGKAEQIFLRGFDCDHGTDIQVSVDGMPVNMVSHAHGQGYADAHFIIPETINNIDFGTGPYYTQQGNLNTAGYVNFATYNNIAKSTVQVEAGRYNTYRTLAMLDLFKTNKAKQSAYIAGEYYYTDGATINKQNFNRFNVFGKYNLALANNTKLTASLSAFKSKWDASGQVPERAVEAGLIDRFGSIDPSEGGNTERYNANVLVAHTFNNGAVWQNQVYYSRYIFNLFSNFTFYLNDDVNGDEINQKESRNVFGYTSSLHHQKSYNRFSITSNYGAGIRYDAINNSQLAHAVKRVFLNDIKKGDIKEANAFAFAQKQLAFGKWLIDAGVRLDYFNFNYTDKLTTLQLPAQGKAIVSPKLNVQYTFSKSVQAYIKAGKGFHSNDTRVVVANSGYDILPAAYGGDIGIILKPTKNLLINVAAWYLYLNQEFVYVGDDGNIEPSGKTRRQGIDVIARYQFNKHLFANANFNITNPRAIGANKGEDYIPLAPTATSTGGVFYKNKEGFNGSVTYRYIKNRPANEDNTIVAKGYFLLDAAINYTKPKYEVGLALENILNVKWNEAQFATESRLQNEPLGSSVTELNYTPGIPFFIRAKLAVFF